MAVSNTQISEEDKFAMIPYVSGGLILQQTPPPQAIQYECIEGVTGTHVTIDPDAVDLEPLDGLSEATIRRRLWVFRNGVKIYYREAAVTDYTQGYNIDFANHRLDLAYDSENEDYEIYLFPA